MLREAEKQFLSALKSADMVTTVLELSKVAHWPSFDASKIHYHACLLPKTGCECIADIGVQAMQCLCSAFIDGMPVCSCLIGVQCNLPRRIHDAMTHVCQYVGCCPATAQPGQHQQIAIPA